MKNSMMLVDEHTHKEIWTYKINNNCPNLQIALKSMLQERAALIKGGSE